MQNIALIISATLMLLLTAVFAWVIANSKKSLAFEKVAKRAYEARIYLFLLIAVLGVVLTTLTLTPWPHDNDKDEVTRQIDVQAQQWLWTMSDDKVRVGEIIEFLLTSKDVNHGFALYAPNNKIVAQMQVMPSLTNKVRYAFNTAGTYKILCLEYCGLAHHGMVAEITVTK
ncbi:MAG: cytochrome C oxidase subunit II [Methylotenera sp.]